MAINTIIVDDEKPAREELAFLLKAFPEIHLVAQGRNGLEAVALIREHSPDLVFLDVQMPGLDGFGVIKKLLERKARVPQIVFATAFDTLSRTADRRRVARARPVLVADGVEELRHRVLCGSGGGRPDMAQAGGTQVDKLDQALERLYAALA